MLPNPDSSRLAVTPEPPPDAARAGAAARAVLGEVGRVVVGQDAVLEQMLLVLLAGGHALVEGVPGTAKTLAIVCLSRVLAASFRRVQFTPDLMPADVTGVSLPDETQRFVFHPGPLFADVVLADEINRAPAKTQAALLEAMQERQVTVDGDPHPLPSLFTVFASQNPVDSEGTYPLPEAQLDRFLLKIVVGYPGARDEVAILERYAAGFDAADPSTFDLRPVLSRDQLLALRGTVRRVRVAESVQRYVVELVRRTRIEPSFALGASPRAAVALFRAAQARALLHGRDYVVPEDVKLLAAAVLRHRIVLTADAEVAGATADERVTAVVEAVEAPR